MSGRELRIISVHASFRIRIKHSSLYQNGNHVFGIPTCNVRSRVIANHIIVRNCNIFLFVLLGHHLDCVIKSFAARFSKLFYLNVISILLLEN